MGDSEKKKAWMAANTVQATAKLNRNTDADIIEYFGDKIPAAVIKAVLREYMERHPKASEYRYGMRLRGYSPGCQPKGVLRREDDTTGQYHDIIVYDRRLSADEIRNYELEELK